MPRHPPVSPRQKSTKSFPSTSVNRPPRRPPRRRDGRRASGPSSSSARRTGASLDRPRRARGWRRAAPEDGALAPSARPGACDRSWSSVGSFPLRSVPGNGELPDRCGGTHRPRLPDPSPPAYPPPVPRSPRPSARPSSPRSSWAWSGPRPRPGHTTVVEARHRRRRRRPRRLGRDRAGRRVALPARRLAASGAGVEPEARVLDGVAPRGVALDPRPHPPLLDTRSRAQRDAPGQPLDRGPRGSGGRPAGDGRLARAARDAGIETIRGRVLGSTGAFRRDWWARDGGTTSRGTTSRSRPPSRSSRTRTSPASTSPILSDAATSLTNKLRALGIRVTGDPGAGTPPAGLRHVATIRSEPFEILLRKMNRARGTSTRRCSASGWAPGSSAVRARSRRRRPRSNGSPTDAARTSSRTTPPASRTATGSAPASSSSFSGSRTRSRGARAPHGAAHRRSGDARGSAGRRARAREDRHPDRDLRLGVGLAGSEGRVGRVLDPVAGDVQDAGAAIEDRIVRIVASRAFAAPRALSATGRAPIPVR